uniref:Uncharacterized protein n=1 Tax=Castor canadensis TaxID=51338 RepID=A0A8C0XEF1_CASCN
LECTLPSLAYLSLSLFLPCVLADSEMLQCIPGHRCGDRTYNTLEQCCDNDTILPLTWTQLCGIYWACFELCHPEPFGSQKEFAVRGKVPSVKSQCLSSPSLENHLSSKCESPEFKPQNHHKK